MKRFHSVLSLCLVVALLPDPRALACGGAYYIDSFLSAKERPADTGLEYPDMVQIAVDAARATSKWQGVFPKEDGTGSKAWCDAQDLKAAQTASGKPNEIPEAFKLYEAAATALSAGKTAEARATFEKILALPPEARRDRQAATMYTLAFIHASLDTGLALEPDQEVSIPAAFKMLDDLKVAVEGGVPDRCGLVPRAFFSGGRLAQQEGFAVEALQRYSAAMAAGYYVDRRDLSKMADAVLSDTVDGMVPVVADPLALAVIAAQLVSDSDRNVFSRSWSTYQYSNWSDSPKGQERPHNGDTKLLDAVQKAAVKILPQASSLAWVAFRAGNVDLAKRYLEATSKDDPFRSWLQSRIAMRAGDYPKARAQAYYGWRLAHARLRPSNFNDGNASSSKLYSEGQRWFADHILTYLMRDAAVAALSEGKFREALGALMIGFYPMEAEFIAERVLTVPELKTLVDALKVDDAKHRKTVESLLDLPAGICDNELQGHCAQPGMVDSLSDILGRRLVRERRYTEARDYLSKEGQKDFDSVMTAIPQGPSKATKPSSMEAARVLLNAAGTWVDGLVSGTRSDPDWYGGGSFYKRAKGGFVAIRNASSWATSSEKKRINASAPTPNTPRHYRSEGLDMAWLAIQAYPDNADETAAALIRAGSWVKNDHPKEADRFYKALVNRCPDTKLGQAAKAKKWFP